MTVNVGEKLRYSRSLDVHKWSEHVEVNKLISKIYSEHFSGNSKIRKKHLKVVLLDLYVAWKDDPELKISYSRNVNSYKPKSRYNSLNISKLTIDVVDKLKEEGLVNSKNGFNDRKTGSAFQARMWPTQKLIDLFKVVKFSLLEISYHEDRETIILRDEDKQDIEYTDTRRTEEMRSVVMKYNKLLAETDIDIPSLKEKRIPVGKQEYVFINPTDKFVRRVFNRNSFNKGGRFYGGWWQRCPKEWRSKIFINKEPTIELDYSGLHILLLYARKGIIYLEEDYGKTDPYDLQQATNLPDTINHRDTIKKLVLIAVNAKNDKSAFQAFRSNAEEGSVERSLTNEQLSSLLDQIKERHSAIAEFFASDAGIDLMKTDSTIVEGVIRMMMMTGQKIPVLCVHDSFIVQQRYRDFLAMTMRFRINEFYPDNSYTIPFKYSLPS